MYSGYLLTGDKIQLLKTFILFLLVPFSPNIQYKSLCWGIIEIQCLCDLSG